MVNYLLWFVLRGRAYSVADLGEGPGWPGPPLFLDQTEALRAEKKFFGDRPLHLSQDLDDRPHPPPPPPAYLRVWIRHCYCQVLNKKMFD